jgi:hypothetical protein
MQTLRHVSSQILDIAPSKFIFYTLTTTFSFSQLLCSVEYTFSDSANCANIEAVGSFCDPDNATTGNNVD